MMFRTIGRVLSLLEILELVNFKDKGATELWKIIADGQ